MNIWINKNLDEAPSEYYNNAYIFNLNRKGYSTMFTNLNDTWLRLGAQSIGNIYEDLFVIGLSVFSVDKRLSRSHFKDCWTRNIDISIPVIELEKWLTVKELWNKMLKFLTGDIWNIEFRKSNQKYSERNRPSRLKLSIAGCTSVCLFSGGLDSFCGAIDLLSNGESLCLFGHNEYPRLRMKQENLRDILRKEYPKQTIEFISFTANSRAPINNVGKLEESENTSRGRSLLFLCAAATIAGLIGLDAPIYIPENGFIGLNLPLTTSRKGSCSTRTTHPYFIKSFNQILKSVGINNKVNNFFAYMTKREVVNQVKDKPAFLKGVNETISCSHPCNPRWAKDGNREYPVNCGYCYPCLIRKSSLLDVELFGEKYSYDSSTLEFLHKFADGDITNDLNAVISAVYSYIHMDDNELQRLIMCSGNLGKDEIDKFMHVYKSTMNDIKEYLSHDKSMIEYIGIR